MKKLIAVLILIPFFIVSACADEVSEQLILDSGLNEIQNSLPDEGKKISGEFEPDGSYDSENALKRLFGTFSRKIKETLNSEIKFALSVLAVAFLSCLAAALGGGSAAVYIDIAGCCAAAYMVSGSVEGIVSQAVSAVNQLSDYSRAALPALFTASAACGAVSSASVKYAASCMAVEVFMSAARDFIIPLIYAYLAVSLSLAVFDNSVLRAVSGLCRNIAVFSMTGMCLAFSAYIKLSGIISGSTDALAVKTARTVISNSLPVVGGIVSDAASVVLASASVIKNSAGIFCLIAVCALCISPFAALSVKMLLYKAVSAAADMLPENRISKFLGSLGSAAAMLLGLVGSCGIMLFISIMSGIMVTGI